MNYDARELVYQNLRHTVQPEPEYFTKRQYQILCNLIRQKKIRKESFDILLFALFEISDWRKLNYCQMHELIFVLTNLDYKKVKM